MGRAQTNHRPLRQWSSGAWVHMVKGERRKAKVMNVIGSSTQVEMEAMETITWHRMMSRHVL